MSAFAVVRMLTGPNGTLYAVGWTLTSGGSGITLPCVVIRAWPLAHEQWNQSAQGLEAIRRAAWMTLMTICKSLCVRSLGLLLQQESSRGPDRAQESNRTDP